MKKIMIKVSVFAVVMVLSTSPVLAVNIPKQDIPNIFQTKTKKEIKKTYQVKNTVVKKVFDKSKFNLKSSVVTDHVAPVVGVVTVVEGNTITIEKHTGNKKTASNVTIAVTDKTMFRKIGTKIASITDVVVGAEVMVMTHGTNTTITIFTPHEKRKVINQKKKKMLVGGSVQDISSNEISIENQIKDNKEIKDSRDAKDQSASVLNAVSNTLEAADSIKTQ